MKSLLLQITDMAYQIEAIPMTLSDFKVAHLLQAKCDLFV